MDHQPSPQNSKLRGIDVAALLAAGREIGPADPLAFAAHQLLLEHESIDRVDIRALAAALPEAVAKAGVETSALEQAVMARMPDDLVPKLRNVLAGKPMVERPRQASWRERHLSWNRWFGPKPWQQTRWPASKHFGRKAMADVDKAYLRTDRAYEALRPYVCPVQFRAEIQKQPHFCHYIIGLVGLYASADRVTEEMERTGGLSDIIRARAMIVLTNWINDRTAARAAGEDADHAFMVANWDIGIDAAVCALPPEHLWKLGGNARSYFVSGIDMNDPAVAEVTREASKQSRVGRERRAAHTSAT
ncbi:MAG: hypothetical protein DCF29_10065 [Alphaproteobacteria bacterium]|nr:MAG: hypothetical protein DCF29_10065 [Alphaproteobacteria bacterium]